MCSSVFQLLGCLLRAAIKHASQDLEASHNGALQQQHRREKDHKKLRFSVHKVKKTGRTAVRLCSSAFEQSPPFDCGPPNACGVTSTVRPQSEGVVLRKGSSAADTSASTPRGDPRVEKELLGCLLRAAIKHASKDLEASHNGALQQQHRREKDHKKLRFQRGDQSEGLAQYWNNVTNFPALSTDPMLVAVPASPCKEMWSDVARKSDSATIQCHSAMSVTPKVAETGTAHGNPSLQITAVASTRAPAVTVFAQVKRRSVRTLALVGGVWMQHKVIDLWGLTSQNHHMIMRDAVVEGSGNFDHLGFFNVHPKLSTRAYNISASIGNAAAAAGIRTRDLRVSSRVP
ncbi:hypothetical protein HPB51_005247 [Rhipicephalus microplus]|uniref:Uncharacterized protein n=1 Tax=Rhipicephalus microplus TaxID=6941 RepID=A0A9J6DZW6_RHIMP|nr:hypothetical protein HPB51_005247 [Rhipicephalus microplus]